MTTTTEFAARFAEFAADLAATLPRVETVATKVVTPVDAFYGARTYTRNDWTPGTTTTRWVATLVLDGVDVTDRFDTEAVNTRFKTRKAALAVFTPADHIAEWATTGHYYEMVDAGHTTVTAWLTA